MPLAESPPDQDFSEFDATKYFHHHPPLGKVLGKVKGATEAAP